MQSDDRDLVRRCLAGEQQAFDALYDRHIDRIYNLLRRLTAHEADAEDLAQETFLAAYRDLGSWRGDRAFGSWLGGIAFHQYTQARRRRAHRETEPLEEGAGLSVPDADPLVHCLRHERLRRIETAIAALPLLYREVFVLVKVESLTYREAARWLEVPLGTLQWRLWRAVCLLQRALGDEAVDTTTRPARSPEPPASPDPLTCRPSTQLERR